MSRIVDRIEEMRKNANMSAASMCKQAGLAPTTYQNYKKRGDEPPVQTLEKLAPVLGTTVGYLRTGKSASANLQAEMEVLTDRIAALEKSSQTRVLQMITDIVSAYESKEA